MGAAITQRIEKTIAETLRSIDKIKKKGRSWYITSGETVCIFDLQKSQWSNKFYVNLGIFLRIFEKDEKRLPEYKSDIRIRLTSVVPADLQKTADTLFDLETPMDDDERQAHIERLIRENAVPLLVDAATIVGVRLLHEKGVFRAAMISPEGREILS